MNQETKLNTDELDALKEVVNIGMGQAGAALSEILEGFVTLKVPEIKLVKLSELTGVLKGFAKANNQINIVRQSFVDQIRGEIVFIFAPIAYQSLGEILGFSEVKDITDQKKTELLLEISNSLASACLMGLSSELSLSVELRPPHLIGLELSSAGFENILFGGRTPNWGQTLLIKIDFMLSDIAFSCEILIFVAEDSIVPLKKAIANLLED